MKKTKLATLSAFFSVILVTFLLGQSRCHSGDKEKMFGTWQMSSSGGPMGSIIEWTFTDTGTFSVRGYPEIKKDGKYQVVVSPHELTRAQGTSQTTITLNIYECTGDCPQLTSVQLTSLGTNEKKEEQMMINSIGPFVKVSESYFK